MLVSQRFFSEHNSSRNLGKERHLALTPSFLQAQRDPRKITVLDLITHLCEFLYRDRKESSDKFLSKAPRKPRLRYHGSSSIRIYR